jgi:hypothetical protein
MPTILSILLILFSAAITAVAVAAIVTASSIDWLYGIHEGDPGTDVRQGP